MEKKNEKKKCWNLCVQLDKENKSSLKRVWCVNLSSKLIFHSLFLSLELVILGIIYVLIVFRCNSLPTKRKKKSKSKVEKAICRKKWNKMKKKKEVRRLVSIVWYSTCERALARSVFTHQNDQRGLFLYFFYYFFLWFGLHRFQLPIELNSVLKCL